MRIARSRQPRPTAQRAVALRALLCMLTAAGAVLPRAAHAQPTPSAPAEGADARPSAGEEAKQKGDDAMVALRYQEAITHYRVAYEATKNPALLYNMGRAYEALAEFPSALDALEEFNDKAPADLKSRVPKLEELLRDIRGRVATIVVSAPVEGAEIRLGERVVGATKTGQVIVRVNAGKHKLVVSKEGYVPFEKELSLVGGRIEPVDAALAVRVSSGVLRITSPVAGATVSVDGRPVGTVPAESTLSAGTHRIALRRDGYEPAETNVVLGAGEKKEIDVPMAQHGSLFGKWWFWTAVGIAAAAGIATLVAVTTEKAPDTGTIPPGQVKAELRF